MLHKLYRRFGVDQRQPRKSLDYYYQADVTRIRFQQLGFYLKNLGPWKWNRLQALHLSAIRKVAADPNLPLSIPSAS